MEVGLEGVSRPGWMRDKVSEGAEPDPAGPGGPESSSAFILK